MKDEIKTVKRCIENEILSDKAAIEINQILIDDLNSQMDQKLSPDDIERDIDPDCNSGVCGAR